MTWIIKNKVLNQDQTCAAINISLSESFCNSLSHMMLMEDGRFKDFIYLPHGQATLLYEVSQHFSHYKLKLEDQAAFYLLSVKRRPNSSNLLTIGEIKDGL